MVLLQESVLRLSAHFKVRKMLFEINNLIRGLCNSIAASAVIFYIENTRRGLCSVKQ
jgi:hypothetical protein